LRQEFGAVAFKPRSADVEASDLAFPNNEHHLPISSFGTEEGMTQKNTSSSTRIMSAFGFGKLGRGGKDASIKKGLGTGGGHLAGATINMAIVNAQNNEVSA
jgi:hypothetical protein